MEAGAAVKGGKGGFSPCEMGALAISVAFVESFKILY